MSGAALALEVRGLHIDLGGRRLLSGLDLAVRAGECVAIVGESGAGKSISAAALLGMLPPDARLTADTLRLGGESMLGADESAWRSRRGRAIGFVGQDALGSLDPLRRVGAEVLEARSIHGLSVTADTVGELLARVAMPAERRSGREYPHELSGGMRQRALIAAALSAGPPVLVADEPTTALDSTVQQRVLATLAALKRSGQAIVLISHDLRAVEQLADTVIVLRHGAVVEQGPAVAVLRAPREPYTRELVAAARLRSGVDSAPGTAVTAAADTGEDALSGTTAPPVLEVRAVSRSFPGRERAVDQVSLRLEAGSTLSVVGESGSGKSTLCRLVLALDAPDLGSVLLHGQPWSALPERARRSRRSSIQYVPQDPLASFDPRHTVGQALAEASARTLRDRRRPVAALLEEVGLVPELAGRRPRTLSGGQRQRVAIARALAAGPEVLVLDEPVSALDALVQRRILELLVGLQQHRGLAILLITHDLAAVEQLGGQVAVMKDGRIVDRGTLASLVAHPGDPFTRELIRAAFADPSAGL